MSDREMWRRPIVALLSTRGVRAAADGMVSASLATYLSLRGLSGAEIGLVVTATLIGSAAMVTAAGLRPDVLSPIRMAMASAVLMVVLGTSFALAAPMVVLVGLALIGPLNPGGGDVSAFLPAEQTMLAAAVSDVRRAGVFARFTLVASIGAAVGGFAAGIPEWLSGTHGWTRIDAVSMLFWAYAMVGAVVFGVYALRVRAHGETRHHAVAPQQALGVSRRTVRDMTLLFALDSAGGGFVFTSIVALWLNRRFGFDLAQVGATFAVASLVTAASSLLSARLVNRWGAVRTMAITHAPAQLLLFAIALAPNATVAVALLMVRALTSNLDVPARSAFVMSAVTPAERAAAASFTNIPRALAAATTPAIAGWMLDRSTFGWPLMVAGAMKLTYDVLLYVRFKEFDQRPPTSATSTRSEARR